jgi:ketosteroid isomerase-like protein
MSNPTRRTAIATTALALTIPECFAQSPSKTTETRKPPAEIQTLIDAHINAFNTQDNNLFFSVFGDTAIIIDGIAPFRWLNPNAPAKWITGVEDWRNALGVTKEHLSYEMGFWNVEGSSAYAVISGTLTMTLKDQSIVRTGTLAYTFAERDGVWKIEAQAWGRTS